MIGQIVNYRYEVLEKIGDGEMFSAYRARDKVMNRLVALKILASDLAAREDFAAAIAAGCQGVGCSFARRHSKGFRCRVQPGKLLCGHRYARGINVKERIRRAGPVAVPLALDIMIPVMEALDMRTPIRSSTATSDRTIS